MLSKLKSAIGCLIPRSFRQELFWRRILSDVSDFNRADLELTFNSIGSEVDKQSISSLWQEVYHTYNADRESAAKYADLDFWLRLNIIRAANLGLDKLPPMRILDLGCGAGYFVKVCRFFGHDCYGLDLPGELLSKPESLIFSKLTAHLGVTQYVHEGIVRASEALPIGGTFDLITGFLVCFNNHMRSDEWSAFEWRAFLDDSFVKLNDNGRLYLELNGNPDRYAELLFYDKAILGVLSEFGSVERGRVMCTKNRRKLLNTGHK